MRLPITIKDGPGKKPVNEMRKLFQMSIGCTPPLASALEPSPLIVDGEFKGYSHEQTDNVWFGFALGMRCAERLDKVGVRKAVKQASHQLKRKSRRNRR